MRVLFEAATLPGVLDSASNTIPNSCFSQAISWTRVHICLSSYDTDKLGRKVLDLWGVWRQSVYRLGAKTGAVTRAESNRDVTLI